MKHVVILLLLCPLLISCEDDETNALPAQDLQDWTTIIIPNGREAYAIAGSIDDTLLVTTMMSAYYTTDGGDTWQESPDFQAAVLDVVERNDTVYALRASGSLQDYVGPPFLADQVYAGLADQYTTNYGVTWQYTPYERVHEIISPIGVTTSKSGITYRIKDNITPLNSDTTSYLTNYSTVEMYHQGQWQTIEFPFEYVLNNVHVDENNRLYVSAGTWKYVQDYQIKGPDEKYPGLVYLYKHPLP